VNPQLQLAASADAVASGAERRASHSRRNGGSAAANLTPLPAPSVVDRARDLQAAQAAYEQSLAHALAARTVEQIKERFDRADRRAAELRMLARRAA
jgi:hypothetical protein